MLDYLFPLIIFNLNCGQVSLKTISLATQTPDHLSYLLIVNIMVEQKLQQPSVVTPVYPHTGTSVGVAVGRRSGRRLATTFVNCYFHYFFPFFPFFFFFITTFSNRRRRSARIRKLIWQKLTGAPKTSSAILVLPGGHSVFLRFS